MAAAEMTYQGAAETATERNKRLLGRFGIYAALIFWAFVSLFPVYWTVTTTFKTARDVTQGHIVPFLDFQPAWIGWRSLGLSPDTIHEISTPREEFLKRFQNSVVVASSASLLAVILGSLAAYGLSRFSYRFAWMRNTDISFFFLSQLILPPVVLALPFLVLYRELALLDTRVGIVVVYTLMVLPIVIWIMRDQFSAIPIELEEAALVDGASHFGAFLRVALPLAVPAIAAAALIMFAFAWNEYLFAVILTVKNAATMPVHIAGGVDTRGVQFWFVAVRSLIAMIPPVLLALLAQRYIVRGLTLGAVKG
jgi:multiple sugar transport system permease protein